MRGEWIEILLRRHLPPLHQIGSLPMRGEWIEMRAGQSLHAGSGSLPMRGEWIEIVQIVGQVAEAHRLSPCGESGLKWGGGLVAVRATRLSPCGESGLK